jgi:NAD-specific glutamate dehydrogenase
MTQDDPDNQPGATILPTIEAVSLEMKDNVIEISQEDSTERLADSVIYIPRDYFGSFVDRLVEFRHLIE